jgi:hypothetical protein
MSAVERLALRKESPETAKLLQQPGNKIIEEGLRRVAPRKPSDVQSTKALAREIQNDNQAVRSIAQLRDELTFTRGGREVTGELPKTLGEALDATSQSANKIANWIDDIAMNASEQGTRVPVAPVINELGKVKVANGYLPNQEALAQKWVETLQPIAQNQGFTVISALRMMTNLNNDIKSIFTGKNVSGDSPELLGMIANDMRQSLNQTLEQATGNPRFAELRRSLGQLMNLEKRLLKTAEKEANKDAKTKMSVFDIIAAEQLIRGSTRGKATGVAEAGASYLTGKALKLLNRADRSVKRVFRAADYLTGKDRMGAPELPPVVPAPRMVKDPSTGKMIPAEQPPGVRQTLGLNEGQPYRPSTVRDPSTGKLTTANPGAAVRSPLEGPRPQPRMYFDKTTGTYVPIDY